MHPTRSEGEHRLSCLELLQKLLHTWYFVSDSGIQSEWGLQAASHLKPQQNSTGRIITKKREIEDNPQPWHFFGLGVCLFVLFFFFFPFYCCFCLFVSFYLFLFSVYWKLELHPNNFRLGNAFGGRGSLAEEREHEGSLQHPWPVFHKDQLHSAAWSIIKDVLIMSSLLVCNIRKQAFFLLF